MNRKGFTLIEVLVSIILFLMVITSVFYYFSNLIQNHSKINEKYKILRITKGFIDSFKWDIPVKKRGLWNNENYIIEWEKHPVEDKRKILYTSVGVRYIQLNLVKMNVLRKSSKKNLYTTNFLINNYLKK